MYSKIAIGNVKKSVKDYSIYFLTLTLSVCIFYTFNSIESQKALLEMSASEASYMNDLIGIISVMSVFVSIILGGLILYANNFLIKKRKKELGIYMTLGMGKNKISKILILETFIVGILSLVSGLLLGLIVSQGLSVFTSKLFDVAMSEYKFIISIGAIGKTILYFGIIFVLVMVFNAFVISRYKIIDLLSAGRKNETIKIKNPFIYLVTFILCLISLGFAYKLVLDVGLNIEDPRFIVSIILGVLGTVSFFFSLAGFGLYIAKKNEKIYFKKLNIFTIKQVNSKVNTNFISMSVISLMLFLTIVILSTGLSFKDSIEEGLKDTTPFDASGMMHINEGDKVRSVEESLKSLGFKFDEGEKYVYYNEYRIDTTIDDILSNSINKKNQKDLEKIGYMNVTLIKVSEYNNIRKLLDKDKIVLKDNEVLITSNFNKIVNIFNLFLEDENSIELNGKKYTSKNLKVIEDSISTSAVNDNILTLVVNDELTNNLSVSSSHINVDFADDNKEKSEEKFMKLFKAFKNREMEYDKNGFIIGDTKADVYASTKGMTTTVLFVGIYLGIVFLISSMAVLALQQLSEASDSIDRYKSLKRIGANDNMINKTIFSQTLIYFSLPVGLAIIHSIVGIKVANDFIAMYNKPNIAGSSIITALVFMVIYLGYFYATYVGYKNIVKND